MGKLHELLAAKKDIKNKANKLINETRETFSKRHDHFAGMVKRYEAFNEELKFEEEHLSESKELVTTVTAKLEYFLKHMKDAINIDFQNDLTNRNAKADIIVEGTLVVADVPAVTLLALEEHLVNIRNVLDAIPTLEPGIKWEPASEIGEHVYKTANDDVKIRTKKTTIYKEVAKATDKHPAQVVPEVQDVPIGKYIETKYSGRISPAEKAKLMDRLEKLTVSVKKARSRANEETLADGELASKLFDYLLK